jgi:hypothetical protein
VAKAFQRKWIADHFRSELERIYGDCELQVGSPASNLPPEAKSDSPAAILQFPAAGQRTTAFESVRASNGL